MSAIHWTMTSNTSDLFNMYTIKKLFRLILTISVLLSPLALADKYADALKAFKEAAGTSSLIDSAYAYALFPVIGKGGFIVGAAHGRGKVYQNRLFIGDIELNQLSVGFQFGGQSYSQLILLKDKRAYEEFVSGSFEFGVHATAVALTVGVNAEASTRGQSTGITKSHSSKVNAKYYKGMAVYTIAIGGLMYEASLGGQKFNFRASGDMPVVKDLSIRKIDKE